MMLINLINIIKKYSPVLILSKKNPELLPSGFIYKLRYYITPLSSSHILFLPLQWFRLHIDL